MKVEMTRELLKERLEKIVNDVSSNVPIHLISIDLGFASLIVERLEQAKS